MKDTLNRKMISRWFVISVILSNWIFMTCAQISFSTNWGSGKRSGYNSVNEPLDNTCLSRTEPDVLYDLVKVIQKETERVLECLQETRSIKQRRDRNYS